MGKNEMRCTKLQKKSGVSMWYASTRPAYWFMVRGNSLQEIRDMKATIEQLKFLVAEMEHTQKEHPKATIYYDWEDHELRITYPLPRDIMDNLRMKVLDPEQRERSPLHHYD